MEYRETYKNHIVNVWTTEVDDTQWIWTYTIDDETRVESHAMSGVPQRRMVEHAISSARRAVDAYPAS